jgi:hypothetical protein
MDLEYLVNQEVLTTRLWMCITKPVPGVWITLDRRVGQVHHLEMQIRSLNMQVRQISSAHPSQRGILYSTASSASK